jgi:hypothetical protein
MTACTSSIAWPTAAIALGMRASTCGCWSS